MKNPIQAQPDAPLPRPDARPSRGWRRAAAILLLGVVSMVFCWLAWPKCRPWVFEQLGWTRKPVEVLRAYKNISSKLFEFDNEYGPFPDQDVIMADSTLFDFTPALPMTPREPAFDAKDLGGLEIFTVHGDQDRSLPYLGRASQ